MADLEPRVAVLEQIARDTRDVLARIDGRLDRIDSRFDRIDTRLDRIDTRLDRLDGRISDNFQFLVRLHILQFVGLAAGIILVLGVIARAQHWI